MSTITITKEFSFEMSHRLEGYDGKCQNIHGHSYRLLVSVKGSPLCDQNHPHHGMVMDFAELKNVVNQQIICIFDHALVLAKGSPLVDALKASEVNIVEVDYQPTCENMLLHFSHKLQSALPKTVRLSRLQLYETATSCAEWNEEN